MSQGHGTINVMDDRDVEAAPDGPNGSPAFSEHKRVTDGPEASDGLRGADATPLDANMMNAALAKGSMSCPLSRKLW